MEQYTAYMLRRDGHLVGFVEFFCSDEGTATERVRKLATDHAVELWQNDRKIAVYERCQWLCEKEVD